jgi:uncharacterized protein YbjQ (UPF0145 family)
VVGVTARTHNPFYEGVKGMDGKSNPHLGIALLRWRKDAVSKMAEAAVAMGANAIVGMRFDNRWVTQLYSEICAYGTAVQVSLLADELPPPSVAPPAPQPQPEPTGLPGPPPRHARTDDAGPDTVVDGTPVPPADPGNPGNPEELVMPATPATPADPMAPPAEPVTPADPGLPESDRAGAVVVPARRRPRPYPSALSG